MFVTVRIAWVTDDRSFSPVHILYIVLNLDEYCALDLYSVRFFTGKEIIMITMKLW